MLYSFENRSMVYMFIKGESRIRNLMFRFFPLVFQRSQTNEPNDIQIHIQ